MDNKKYDNFKNYMKKERSICDNYKIIKSNSYMECVKNKENCTKEPLIELTDRFTNKLPTQHYVYNNNNYNKRTNNNNINRTSNNNINRTSNSNNINRTYNNNINRTSNSNNINRTSNSNNINRTNNNNNINRTNNNNNNINNNRNNTNACDNRCGDTYNKTNIFTPRAFDNKRSGSGSGSGIFTFSHNSVDENNSQNNKFSFSHYDHISNVTKDETSVPTSKLKHTRNYCHSKHMIKEWTINQKIEGDGEEKGDKKGMKEKPKQTQVAENILQKNANKMEFVKREHKLFEDFINRKKDTINEINKTENAIKENILWDNSLKSKNGNTIDKHNNSNFKCNEHLFTDIKTTVPFEKEDDIKLEDIYFDIHMDDKDANNNKNINNNNNNNNIKQENEPKDTNHKSSSEKVLKQSNEDVQILLDHIKRLEHQNEIFLNNLLNMYYVCMDYIKMQDSKIKDNEKVIENLEKQIKQKDNIINILQNKSHKFNQSLNYEKMNK